MPPGISAPSAFYRAWLWRVGMGAVRSLPAAVLRVICLAVAEIYYRTRRERRAVVVRNLLPVAGGDRAAAAVRQQRDAADKARSFRLN
ncbi:MAG: hypothetical protein WCL11_12965, partial [Verrucomicrobiota bacterium]